MASILFLDSPVGSGFSYARDSKAYEVGDISSSKQVLTFLRKVETQKPCCIISWGSFFYKNMAIECNQMWRSSDHAFVCFGSCSGLMITQRNFWTALSMLVGIHMLGRWFLLLHTTFPKVMSWILSKNFLLWKNILKAKLHSLGSLASLLFYKSRENSWS